MRSSALVVWAVVCLLTVSNLESAAGWQQADEGTSVEAGEGLVELGAWIEVDVPGAAEPDSHPNDPSLPPCYFRQANYAELNAWLDNDFVIAPNPEEVYILKLCETDEGTQLVMFWVHQPAPPKEPPPPTIKETTRLRNEAWGRLAIPEPTTQMAPGKVTIVQIPTFVWVSAADRTPMSETVTTTLDGHELSSPLRLPPAAWAFCGLTWATTTLCGATPTT